MLNVLLVTQDDPFYVSIFFKELLKYDLSQKFNLVGVVIQPPLGKKSTKRLIRQMFNFYGSVNFLLIGIKYFLYKVVSIIAVNFFRGVFPGSFSVKHILLKKDIRIISLSNINSKESISFLKKLNLDIIFSIAASQIFKNEILSLPKLGCYNIHTSKLPKNRGMMPNFWSLYNYDIDSTSAITVHKMNEELDDGEILLQTNFELNPKETLDALIKRTKKMSVDTFLAAINLLTKDKFNLLANDSKYATYNSFPVKDDVKRFLAKGLKLR